MNKNLFVSLGLFTLFGFSAIAWLIIYFFIGVPFGTIFQHGVHWFYQVSAGLAYGSFAGWLGWLVVKSKLLYKTRKFYSSVIQELDLNIHEIIFISFCAGVGEEILFRAAVQYYLGVWLTAILFVAIHGYLSPVNWRISVYGAFMTVIIAGIGYMFNYLGLFSAISAHFAIDVVLLWYLTKNKEEEQTSISGRGEGA
jgi:uncharacterized protein